MAAFFLFILLLPLYLQVNTQELSSEQTILLSMKQHWGNPTSLDSWNSASFPCDWPEIECIFGAVTGLRLAAKYISGTIPSTICQLKNLVMINLSKNNLSGDIPVSLYNCSKKLEKEFLAEIWTPGTIWHNNIVKLLCYISGKNVKPLVYQYFENKSLDQWLHGNNRTISSVGNSSATKLDWPMRLNIAFGAAQGLCYRHHDCSPPIIHHDIKSRYILRDSELNAKITDFGLAKFAYQAWRYRNSIY